MRSLVLGEDGVSSFASMIWPRVRRSTEDVITVLRAIDVPVRSHLTVLTDDQVARVRARWEREKRALKERAAAPAAAPSRRRKGAAAASTPPLRSRCRSAWRWRRRRVGLSRGVETEEASVATEVQLQRGRRGRAVYIETAEEKK